MVYIRKYELTIGAPPYTKEIHTPEKEISPDKKSEKKGDKDFRTAPSEVEAKVISSLHIEAEINYSTNKTASNNQPASIKIYNLSPSTQNFIRATGIVFLKAGYEITDTFEEEKQEGGETTNKTADTNLPLIFTGQIESVVTTKEGEDTVTTLLCKDLGFAQKVVKISKSFAKGHTYKKVIEELLSEANSKGLPTGHFIIKDASKLDSAANNGMTVEGTLVEELNTICSDLGYRAYISLGKIYVEPKATSERKEAVVLKPINIKGQIRREESNEGDTPDSDNRIVGIKVNTFLNGGVTTNKMLKIAEGQYAGLYKITDVIHQLSYEGDEWDTEISATAVS